MNLFSPSARKNKLKLQDIPDPPPASTTDPPPAYTTDENGRPRLTDAFATELRESVRNLNTQQQATNNRKKSRFAFLGGGGKKKASANIPAVETTPDAATTASSTSPTEFASRSPTPEKVSTPSSRERPLQVNGDDAKSAVPDMGTPMKDAPNMNGSKAKHSAPSPRGRRNPSSRSKDNHNSPNNDQKSDAKTRTITKVEADELKRSFHDQMNMQDGHRVKPSNGNRRLTKQPILSEEMKEELHSSFRKRKEMQTLSKVSGQVKSPSRSEKLPPPPPLSNSNDAELSPGTKRPSLCKDVVDELRQSFVYRKAKKQTDRDALVARIMKRRESKRALLLSDHHGQETPGASQHDASAGEFATTRTGNASSGGGSPILQQVKFLATSPSVSKPKWQKLQDRLPTQAKGKKKGTGDSEKVLGAGKNGASTINSGKRNSLERKVSRYNKGLQKNSSDTPTLAESGQFKEAFTPFASPHEMGEEARSLFQGETVGFDVELNNAFDDNNEVEVQGDFDTYKSEWARLIKEKKRLKNKLSTSEAQQSLLQQQVDDLGAKVKDLQQQRDHWQGKANKLGKLQDKERIKFDNSTDLIAQARVELTKSLNDARIMRAKIHDLELTISTKDRRIEELDDTIKFQGEKIDEMNEKLRDKEEEGRTQSDEKRKIEDELAILIASRDGDDLDETLRQLEQERERWLWQREQDLEAKHAELQKENDHILEREKQRHRQEMEKIAEEAQRTERLEEEQQKLQEFINQQLKDMKEANHELQEKLTSERLDSTAEIKKQDNTIAQLEQLVLDLKQQLANNDQSVKQDTFKRAEMEPTKDDLRDAQKQNKLLGKEIASLKKKVEELRDDSHDWREIVLPGYKNLRGVTFGDPNSKSLAGFLTILVEEQNAKKGERSSKKSSPTELKKCLGDRKSKPPHKPAETTKKTKRKKVSKTKGTEKEAKKAPVRAKKRAKAKSDRKRKRSKPKTKKNQDVKRQGGDVMIDNGLSLDKNLELMQSTHGHGGKDKKKKRKKASQDDSSMVVLKRNHPHKSNGKRRSRTMSPRRSKRRYHDRHGDYDFGGGGQQTYAYYRKEHRRSRSRSQPPPSIFLQ